MNTQSQSGSGEPYPRVAIDEERLKRGRAQDSSLSGPEEVKEGYMFVGVERVLAPAIGIVAEEEEIVIAIRRVRDYNHALICHRNQLALGMSNPGPR